MEQRFGGLLRLCYVLGMNKVSERLGFVVSDPQSQAGLIEDARGIEPTGYINRYSVGEKVRCAFCDGHTPHNRGVTASLPDGRLALCGRCCAARLFPEVDDRLWAHLMEREKAAIARNLLEPLLDGADSVIEAVKLHLALERRIVDAAKQLVSTLGQEAIKRRTNERGRIGVHDESGLQIGIISGEFLMREHRRRLFEAASILARIKRTISAESSDAEFRQAGLDRQEAIRSLEEGVAYIAEAIRFFRAEAVDPLATLLLEVDRDALSVEFEELGDQAEIVLHQRYRDQASKLVLPILNDMHPPAVHDLVDPLKRRGHIDRVAE